MDMKVIEYVVFFGMLLFAFLALIFYKPPKQETVFNPEILKCESPIERKVYNALTMRHIYPVSQYPVGKYRLDLAIPSQKIAIECDGKAYHSSPEQKAHDKKRDAYLRRQGWTVLRFSGRRIHRDIAGVVKRIEEHLQ